VLLFALCWYLAVMLVRAWKMRMPGCGVQMAGLAALEAAYSMFAVDDVVRTARVYAQF
jgi:hypothetical protein